MTDQPINNVYDLLVWLSGPGAFIVVNWFLSWLLEEFDFWKKLKSKVKSLIIFGLSALVGVGAAAMMRDQALIEKLSPFITPILAVIGAWLTTQVAHRLNPKAKELKPIVGTELFEAPPVRDSYPHAMEGP